MTAPADSSLLEERVGHYYQMDGTYLVGREKLREYARAVQDYNPVHWDVAAAAELGYSDVIAPLTFTSTPGMSCNRRMFEQIVVGYDTYLQTEEVFEQHRPIVAGDELTVAVELTSVRRTAGRDFITVTNTFTDTAGEVVHTLHTTVVGVTSEDISAEVKVAVQNAMMHDINIFDVGADGNYVKEVRPAGELRISDGGMARTPGTPSFDDVQIGYELPVHHTRLSRGDLVNYAGVAGDANPIHWDETIAKVAGLPDVIAHGMLTMGLGAGYASTWLGDPGAVTRYTVRLSQPAIVPAKEGADIEFSGRVKSLDPETRTGVVVVAAKSAGKKIFGMATLNVRFS
ncbi:MaoC family dehydratase N-terminal domain-containing protein [Mycobacterium barrassiae]|uniref:fused (3R)-hydroxyacyl-ACP dehydratase subunits HadA/HadB n=1 Tax=Mycobacterium barrassiae TaxID=319709 RepID=UPI002265D112|nr:fused (3R)-hydroxyacyl-ACP dehydratase subunits HadA/HadB [Mycobacterium barrassiae]MCV7301811.1 MaoC family dehydratase N-terminal domain-containing protein [Mycobacterium barrassiae]